MNIGRLSGRLATPAKERGVVLFIALIVLVVMSLIGISMIRQGSSSQMIVGNLAFKEGADAAADLGVERARAWLTSPPVGKLDASDPTIIYVADGLNGSFDPFSYTTWDALEQADLLGQRVTFIVHRLCDKAKPVVGEEHNAVTGKMEPTNNCILYSETSSKEGIDYGNAAVAGFMPYYRVTVRVRGPRNTTSYVQALLY